MGRSDSPQTVLLVIRNLIAAAKDLGLEQIPVALLEQEVNQVAARLTP